MFRTTQISLASLTAAGLLAFAGMALAPALADAKGAPTYEVSIKGDQVSTWNHSHAAEFDCDATVTGAGSQSVGLVTERPVELELVRRKGAPPVFATPGDPHAEHGLPLPIEIVTVAIREGYENVQAPGGYCNGTGGWDGEAPAPDCGGRVGFLDLHLGYGDPVGGPTATSGKNVLTLSGRYSDFILAVPIVDGRWDGEPLGHTYDACPFWPAGQAAGLDEILATGEKLPVSKLLRLRPGRKLKVSAGEIETAASGDFSGETAVAWNLVIRRVG